MHEKLLRISNAFIEHLTKLVFYDNLALRRCEKVLTQNPNEALHSVVWNMAPKNRFTSSADNKLAMFLGVGMYNDGFRSTMTNIMEEIGIVVSANSEEIWQEIDDVRVADALYQSQPERIDRRKKLKRKKSKKEYAFQHAEGDTYKHESFYNV